MRESPAVRLGIPKNPEQYLQKTVDGIRLFIPEDLIDEPVTIVLHQFLWWRSLQLEGWHLA
jgi:hypothetical protein